MNDESNGESTFEFVDKRMDELSVSGDTTKIDSSSTMSSSASQLTSFGGSVSPGNLLSNIAPPSALPSFVANPSVSLLDTNSLKNESVIKQQGIHNIESTIAEPSTSGIQTKQPQPQSQLPTSKNIDSVQSDSSQSIYDPSIVGGTLFSWVKDSVVNNSMLNKVAEKAKCSVNSIITTFDPQMREFIYSGGDVEIIVASDKELKVSPIREAFQGVFGKATVTGVKVDTSAIASQPVGIESGIIGAEYKIKYTRNALDIPKNIPVIAVQSFLLQIGENKWYEMAAVVLDDSKNNVTLQMFTQMTPVPSQIVTLAQESTPDDYPLRSLGLAVPIGSLMATKLQVSFNDWHHALTGVSRRDTILLAAQSLAGIYKNTITTV